MTDISLIEIKSHHPSNPDNSEPENSPEFPEELTESMDLSSYEMVRRKATRLTDNDYFRQDSRSNSDASDYYKRSKTTLITQYVSLDEVFSDFNPRGFFTSFVYHFLYFAILGPLVSPIIWLFDGYNLSKNMEFWTISGVSFYQFLLYASSFSSFIIFFFYDMDDTAIAAGIGLLTCLVFRCSVIALKYAFINKDKFFLLRRHHVPYDIRKLDQIMPGWTHQDHDHMYKDLRESMKRHEIDDALFYFDFYQNTEENPFRKELQGSDTLIKKSLQENGVINYAYHSRKNPIVKGKFHGLSLLYHFIKRHNKNLSRQNLLIWVSSFLLAAFFFVAPYLINVQGMFSKGDFKISIANKFAKLESYSMIGLLTSWFPTLVFAMMDFFFLLLLISDSGRVKNIMTTLTDLVKLDEENDHLVNFLDIMSLKTWSYMRRCAIDYGRNYRRRVEYAAVIVSVCSFLTGIYLAILYLLGEKNPFLLATVIVVLKLGILIAILVVNFVSSARVNEAFLSQKAACQRIKNEISYILKFKDYYLEGGSENVARKADRNLKMAEKIKEEFKKYQERFPSKKMDEYLEDVLEALKDVMYEIEFDLNYNAFRVLGVKAEINLLKRVVLFVGSSVLTTIIKYIMNNRNNF